MFEIICMCDLLLFALFERSYMLSTLFLTYSMIVQEIACDDYLDIAPHM